MSLTALVGLAVSESLGGVALDPSSEATSESKRTKWDYSFSASTYVVRDSHDYVNPIITADHDWLHLEARYNYEELKTGSMWLGYNFSIGQKLVFDATPMLGGVFGNLTGIAPGYELSLTCDRLALSTQGEFVFDTGDRTGSFFYSWSELSFAPVEWLRAGMVVERTKAYGTNFELQPGALVGFNYRKLDFTTYYISPGSKDATFVFALTVDF
jgi:hypothetical protein